MQYWLGRLVETIPMLIGISLLAFLMFWLSPRDPVALVVDPTMISRAQKDAVRQQLGLNDPLPVQYARMMRDMVTGNLRSFRSKQPTFTIVREALPATALVGGLGIGIGCLGALWLGLAAGRKPDGWANRVVSWSMVTSIAVPPFLLGLLLVRLFAEQWRLLPATGLARPGVAGFHPEPRYLVLPVAVVAFGIAPILARYLRDALVVVLQDDYVRTARAKGLDQTAIVWRHAMRNALIPVVSLLNTMIPATLGGLVIIESVFGLPGLGRVTTNAALSADYPVVLTNVMFVALLTIGTSLVVDGMYGMIDPRIRVQ